MSRVSGLHPSRLPYREIETWVLGVKPSSQARWASVDSGIRVCLATPHTASISSRATSPPVDVVLAISEASPLSTKRWPCGPTGTFPWELSMQRSEEEVGGAESSHPAKVQRDPQESQPPRPHIHLAAAAAAKSLQLCPTLCDPIEGSPPRLPHPWDSPGKSGLPFPSPVHACMLSCFSRVQPCVTPWTAAHQAPLSTGFSRQEYWDGLPFPSPIFTLGLLLRALGLLFVSNCHRESYLKQTIWGDDLHHGVSSTSSQGQRGLMEAGALGWAPRDEGTWDGQSDPVFIQERGWGHLVTAGPPEINLSDLQLGEVQGSP